MARFWSIFRPTFQNILHIWWEEINNSFFATDHLPLPQVNINTNVSFRAKSWLGGGAGGKLPNPFQSYRDLEQKTLVEHFH